MKNWEKNKGPYCKAWKKTTAVWEKKLEKNKLPYKKPEICHFLWPYEKPK